MADAGQHPRPGEEVVPRPLLQVPPLAAPASNAAAVQEAAPLPLAEDEVEGHLRHPLVAVVVGEASVVDLQALRKSSLPTNPWSSIPGSLSSTSSSSPSSVSKRTLRRRCPSALDGVS